MAIAVLNSVIMNAKLTCNEKSLEIAKLQSEKNLATYEQLDFAQVTNAKKAELKQHWKQEYNASKDTIYEDVTCYTEIDEYINELNKLEADFEEFQAELTAWEISIDAQITTADVELKETEAYLEAYESKLSENISNDFNYGIK